LLSQFLVAQIEVIPETELGVKDKEEISKMKKDPWVAEYAVIKFNKGFDEFGEDFEIPLPTRKKAEKIIKIENDSPLLEKHFKGKINGHGDGTILELMDEGFGIFGYALVDGEQFIIQAIAKNRSIIYKNDASKLTAATCSSENGLLPRKDSEKGTYRTGPNSANCRVKILILYTQQALNAAQNSVSNITALGYTALSQTNTSLVNSGINGRVTGGAPVFLNQANLQQPINNNPTTAADNLSTDPWIQNLRVNNRADIVVLLHQYTFNVNGGEIVGSVGLTGFANPTRPVAVVKTTFATNAGFTFAHEVGHLFNARHFTDNASPPGRGHQFAFAGNNQGTLLTNTIPFGQRVLQFSNPDINFNGLPTGTADRDNSFNINTSFCPLSAWINSYDVVLEAPSSSFPGSFINVIGYVYVDQYPCTLNWYTSTYPYPNTLVKTESITNTSSGGSYGFTFPSIPPNSYYYIFATLIPPPGFNSLTKSISIYNSSSYKIIIEGIQSNLDDELVLMPNPINDQEQIYIRVPQSAPERGNLQIYSLNGSLVMDIKYENRFAQIDGDMLKNGTYLVYEKTTKMNQKLIKL